MASYHNTTNETDRLEEYEQKAQTQEEKVLAFFRDRQFNAGYTPSSIHDAVFPLIPSSNRPRVPIQSVRRALTNLTNAGLLVKTSFMRIGPYNKPEGVWKLAEPVQGELI